MTWDRFDWGRFDLGSILFGADLICYHIKQGERLSEHTKRLPPLAIGDCVRIQNQIRHYPLKWDKTGVIIEVRQFDQYAVKVDGSGRVTLHNRKYVHVKSLKTTKTIQDDIWCKNVPVTSTFDTKQVSKPTSDTLMGIPKTSILLPAKRYLVVQATSDSKGSSTPGLTYSPNVPNQQKVHIPATTKTGLSSDSPRVVNTHPERRRLEFSKTQHEEQGTLPTTNTPTLITHPAEPHSHDYGSCPTT